MQTLLIGWTTTATQAQAKELAALLIEKQWVACAQIDGPILSLYRWEGKTEDSQEYRLTLKFSCENKEQVYKCVLDNHPYSTPQWVVAEAIFTDPDYLAWVTQQTPSIQ